VLAHYGWQVAVSRIRESARTDEKGTTMLGMLRALEAFQFEAKGLCGTAEHLNRLPTPFIAHIIRPDGYHHYVTVYKVSRKDLRIMDPECGRMKRWLLSLFKEQWSGNVIALVPRPGVPENMKASSNPDRFIQLLRPLWKPVLQAMITAILYTLLGLSSSIYLGKLTDHVFVTHNQGLLNLMSLAMIWITLAMIYLSISRSGIMLKTGQVIDTHLIASYYRHLFSLPQRFFDSMKTGEIISRINDAVKIRVFINEAAIGIMVNFLVLAFSFTTMFILHLKLSWIMASILPIYAVIYLVFNQRNRRLERGVMENAAKLEDQLVESLEISYCIRQFGLRGLMQQRTEKRLNALLDSVYHSGWNAIFASAGTETVNRLFTILLLWVGTFFVIRDSLTPGNLLSFYALMGYFTGPVAGLIGASRIYQNAAIAADRLFEIFDLEAEEKAEKKVFQRDQFGDIVLKGVSFSYGSRGAQLKEVDLVIPEGCITAITGASGSGKSTLSRLVQHLYPVDEGRITIRGCDTRSFTKESVRSIIGVVSQKIHFFTGSLLENIAPGIRDPDIVLATRLLKQVGLQTLIDSLPEGLDSLLTGNGSNLSGGERQRLALVRALYRKPLLLIMDEATSSLDPQAAFHIHRMLLGLREQKMTILLITHQSSFASLADHLYRMDLGRIVERKCSAVPENSL
jgi:ATP-binding cassette subfamily B protein